MIEQTNIQKETIAALFSPALYDRFLAVEHIKRANPNAPITIDEAGIVRFDIQPKESPPPGITITIDGASLLITAAILTAFVFSLLFGGVTLYCLIDTIF